MRKLAPAFLVHARPVEQLEPRVSYAPDCPAEEVQRFKPDPVTPLQVFDLNEPGFSMLLTVIGPGQVKSARVRLVLNALEVPYEQQWRVPDPPRPPRPLA